MEHSNTSNYILLYFLSSDPWSSCEWFPLEIFVSWCGVDIFQRATEIWEIFLRLQSVLKRDKSCYIYCCNDYIRPVNNNVIMMPWCEFEPPSALMTECESYQFNTFQFSNHFHSSKLQSTVLIFILTFDQMNDSVIDLVCMISNLLYHSDYKKFKRRRNCSIVWQDGWKKGGNKQAPVDIEIASKRLKTRPVRADPWKSILVSMFVLKMSPPELLISII